jgi:hypothetical protein
MKSGSSKQQTDPSLPPNKVASSNIAGGGVSVGYANAGIQGKDSKLLHIYSSDAYTASFLFYSRSFLLLTLINI